MNKQWIALILVTALSGCGGGTDIPSSAPVGVVSGNAVDALIINGTVNAYDFSDGKKGELVSLAPAVTDEKGFFELSIQTGRDRPVLLEVTGGYYIEEASGKAISLNENQYLWAAINYTMGADIKTMVTTWTHLAAAEAWHLVENGEAAPAAIDYANGAVSDWLGVNISTTYPINITDPNYSSAGFYDGVKYGLQSAALSQWAYQLSELAGIEPHTNFTSIVLSNIMVNDIQSDGRLDGVIDGARIVLGPVTLSNEVYRTNLARSALHVVNRDDINRINVTVADTVPYVQRVAAAAPSIFAGKGGIEIAKEGPTSTLPSTSATLVSGATTVELLVSDYIGIKAVELWANGTLLDSKVFDRGHSELIPLSFDSAAFDDGMLSLEVRATNSLGIESVTPLAVIVANNTIGVEFFSGTLTRETRHQVNGQVLNAAAPITVTVADQAHTFDGAEFAFEVALSEGINTLALNIQDADGKQAQFEHTIQVDRTPPRISWDTPERALTYDGSGAKEVSFPLNGELPLYIRYENARLGTLPATRAALGSARIPYLEAVIEDSGVVFTDAAEISTKFTLEVDDKPIVRDRAIQRNVDGQVILPLVQEFIPAIFEIEPASKVRVRVTAEDNAGNQRSETFPLALFVDMPAMVIDSTFSQSTLALNRYHSPTVGTQVKTCAADSQGDCALRLHGAYPLLRLSADGGEYVDLDGQRFPLASPIATLTDFYEEDKTVYFSPLSAVLLGLYDHELGKGDLQPAQALQRARGRLIELYGFDPLNTPVGDLTGELDDANRHALLLGAYSNLYDSLALETPLQLLRAMQDDVAADGYLDGKGTEGEIELGNQVITAEFWRQDVAQAINTYHANLGKPLGNTTVGQWAQQLSLNTESIYRAEDTPEGWDKHAPQLVSTVKMGHWLTGQTTFPVTASDDTGIARLALTIANRKVGEQFNRDTAEFALDTTAFEEGENAASIEIVDEVANTVTQTGKIHIDNTDPVLTASPLDGQWVTGSVSVNIGVEEISPYRHVITSGQTEVASVSGPGATINTTTLSDGPWPLRHTVTDAVNRSTSINTDLSVDNTAPVIQPTTYDGQWLKGSLELPIRVVDVSPTTTTVSLDGREQQTYSATNLDEKLRLDTRALTDGSHTLLIQTADSVAKTAQRTETLKVDNTPATIYQSSQDSQWLTGQVQWYAQVEDTSPYINTVLVNGVKLGDYNGDRVTIDTTSLSDGNHQLTYRVTDSAGNNSSRNFTLKTDNTDPVIADWTGAGAWYRRDFSFSTTVSDVSLQTSSLTLNTTKLVDFTDRITRTIDVDALSNGTHTLKVEARDLVPNTAQRSWQFKVDKTGPTLSSSNGWDQRVKDVTSVTVSGTVSDAHSGVSRVTVDGQNATLTGNNWSRTISVTEDGDYSWAVVAYDQAGNVATNTENVMVTSTPADRMRMTISGGGKSLTTNTQQDSYTLSGVRAESLTSPVSLTLTTQFLDCAGSGTCSVTWSGNNVTQQGNNAVISKALSPKQSVTGTATATFEDSINGHTVTVQVGWTLDRTGECTPGQTQDRVLLNCGNLNTHQTGLSQRTCQANSLWGRWVVIRDPVCSPNPIP